VDNHLILHLQVAGGVEFLGEGVAVGDAELEDRELAFVEPAELPADVVDFRTNLRGAAMQFR
jgi:hypothetical protein